MNMRGLAWSLATVLGLLTGACFEDIEEPAGDTEGTGTEGGTTAGPGTTTVDTDPPGTTTVDPDSGSDDGAAECASSEACVDLAPPGWDGPVAYFEGDELAMLPSCAAPFGGLDVEVFADLVAEPAQCDACECGAASDVECSPPSIRLYGNSNCGGTPGSEFQLGAVDECTVFPNGVGAYGAESDPVVPIAGTGACAPTGGAATLDAPRWSTQLRACAPPTPTLACGDGKVCAPAPGPPFAAGLCIHRPGDVACPAGDYDQRLLRYTGVDDARGCAACECDSPEGGTCSAEILFSYTNTCTDDYLHLINPGSGGCTTLWGDEPSSGMLLVDAVDGASCTPSGGAAQGEAQPTEPVTFCCTG